MNLRTLLSGMVMLLTVTFLTTPVFATDGADDATIVIEDLKTKADFEAALEVMKTKVIALKAEKRAAETKAERKVVKQEIKEVKEEMKLIKQAAANGGIYIGGGALIVIILLLLLL